MRLYGAQSIAVNALNLAGARFVTIGARAVYIFVLADMLGPEVYGLLAYGTNWYLAFMPLALLGLQPVLGRLIGRGRDRAAAIASTGLAIRLATTVVATAACIAVAWVVEADPQLRTVLALFGAALFGRGFAVFANSVFVAYEASKFAFRLDGSFRLLELAVGVALLLAGGGLLEVAALHAAVFGLQAVAGLVLLRRVVGGVALAWSGSAVRAMLTDALPLAAGMLLVGWMLQGPVILFRQLDQPAALLGQVGLAFQAFGVLASVPGALVLAALPVLSRATARRDGKEQLFVDAAVRAVIVFGAAAALLATGLGVPLLRFLLGPDYHDGALYIAWGFWLVIPWSVAQIAAQTAVAHGRLAAYVAGAGLGALAMSVVLPLLTVRAGAAGAFLGAAAGGSLWAVFALGDLVRRDGLTLGRVLLRPVVVAAAGAGACLAALPAGGIAAMATGLAVLAAAAWILRVFAPDERDAAWRFVVSRMRR